MTTIQPPQIEATDLLHCAAILDAYLHRNQTLWAPYTAQIIELLQVAGTRGANPEIEVAAPGIDTFVDELRQLPWPAAGDGHDAGDAT